MNIQQRVSLGLGIGLAILVVNLAMPAWAFDSTDATALGDQGSDFGHAQQVFIFPHTLGEVGDRVLFQFTGDSSSTNGAGYRVLDVDTLLDFGNTDATTILYNTQPDELSNGAGLVLSPIRDLNVGLWFGQYRASSGAFLAEAMSATGWTSHVGVGGGANDLASIDPYLANVEAVRKLDLFASYRVNRDLDLGLRMWWGSAGVSILPDEALGPIDVNPFSDTEEAPDAYDVQEGVFSLNDFGLGLSAGYNGVPGLSVDLGFKLNLLGSTYNPNNLGDFYDMGGLGLGLKARAFYELASTFDLGGSVTFYSQSMSFEPKRQRDGGNLEAIYLDIDDPDALANPGTGSNRIGGAQGPAGDSTLSSNELSPVTNTVYTKSLSQLDVALLARYRPSSRVSLYGALGIGYAGAGQLLDVAGAWQDEDSASLWALPFARAGVSGVVTDWLDLMMGFTSRWDSWTRTERNFDDRIPNDNYYQGGGEDGPAGNEDSFNANRREIINETSASTGTTQVMMGLRAHSHGLSLAAHVNSDALFNGLYMVFGESGTTNNRKPLMWLSVTYDWGDSKDAPVSSYRPSEPEAPVDEAPVIEEEEPSAPMVAPSKPVIPTRKASIPSRPSSVPRRPIVVDDEDEDF